MPKRPPETLRVWMKPYSHVQVVSRDGFTGLRQEITNVNTSILYLYYRCDLIAKYEKTGFTSPSFPLFCLAVLLISKCSALTQQSDKLIG